MPRLRAHVPVRDELVRHLRRSRDFRGARETEHEQVQDQAVVLRHERRELQAADQTVRVRVAHVLVRDDDVVLRGDVVRDVMIDDQTHEAVEHREVHLFKHAFEPRLKHHHALALVRVPHVREVVNPLAPLVHEQRRWLRVRGLDPVREQVPLIGLVPDVLVEVRIRDLLQRLDLVHGNEVRVQVHELDANLLERPLRQQVSLDARQRLVRVIERLLDEPELLALRLV
mmetsp:Transcript_3094/g.10261  ORF Transcript_3094/g.10261 Transcript_3094/m.10261 type:complete len:228 (-) Transcript_3094:2744-3427(-)